MRLAVMFTYLGEGAVYIRNNGLAAHAYGRYAEGQDVYGWWWVFE